jgi:hypothetical protein
MRHNNTAVLIIGFNRPDLLEKLLCVLPKFRKIYISIDGWRNDMEKLSVIECRNIARNFQQARSDNPVKLLFSDTNLGCKLGVTSAINWIFSFEESAIILEDDVYPSTDFFTFCDTGLSVFRDCQNIWQLSGWTPIHSSIKKHDAYLTRYPHIWGWATWRSRWDNYDVNLNKWEKNEKISDLPIFVDPKPHRNLDYWCRKNLSNIKDGIVDTWDFQLAYSMWQSNSFSVSAGHVLCSNLGFDNRATHTKKKPSGLLGESIPLDFLPKHTDWESAFNQVLNSNESCQYDWMHEQIAFRLDKYDVKSRAVRKAKFIIIKIINFLMIRKIIFRSLAYIKFKMEYLKLNQNSFNCKFFTNYRNKH